MGSPGTLPKTRGNALPFHSTFFLHLFVADSTFNSTLRKRQRSVGKSTCSSAASVSFAVFFCSDFSFESKFQQTCSLPNWKGIFAQIAFLKIKSGSIGKHSVSKGGLSCSTMFRLPVEKLLNIKTPEKKKKIPLKIHLNQN